MPHSMSPQAAPHSRISLADHRNLPVVPRAAGMYR